MPRVVTRNVPYGVLFNGTTQSGSTGVVSMPSVTSFTHAIWVLVTSASATSIFTELSAAFFSNNAFVCDINASTPNKPVLEFSVRDSLNAKTSRVLGSFSVAQQTWLRLVCIWDSSLAINQTRMYANGLTFTQALDFNQQCTTPMGSSGMYYGARNNTSFRFAGAIIPGYFLANYVANAQEIKDDYYAGKPISGGTKIWDYRCNEGSGATIKDYSGNGYDITLVGGPLWVPGPLSARSLT